MNFAPLIGLKLSPSRRRIFQLGLVALTPALFGQPANVQLPAAAKGAAAVAALGAHLPEVAKAYGLQPQQLASLLQTQRSLGVDQRGALLFACEGLAVTGSGALVEVSASSGGTVANAMTPNSSVTQIANGQAVDAFKLHSLPGVGRKIFLDFDGHVTTGTSWNGGATITSQPFDTDGSPGSFSEGERVLIQKIWQRVAEDYAPFGVDVTTEDPGLEGLRKSTSSDTAFGIRVVISPTNWYNSGAGGVAYIGSFSWNSDTPCFAFSQQLANGEKYIAECISHEVGHTVSLLHDGLTGTGATEYYQGQGNWAPIMGVGYYKSVVQFSKGEYANANNTQDDLQVMLTHIPLAADDHGATTGSATLLSGPTVNSGGTIETSSDVDFFRFDAGSGAVALSIVGPAPDSNVDLKAELLNGSGQVIAASDSTSVLSASISANVSAGTYYLKISSVGNGSAATTGYSAYGSIGNYLITGSFATGGMNQAPTAVATGTPLSGVAPLNVNFSSSGSWDPDGSIVSRSWNFGNGQSGSGENASTTYNTPGTYYAVVSVVDNGGLVATDTVVVTVTAAPNLLPTAVASTSSATSGLAPLTVNFSSAGSGDSDGTISTYAWDFGDGTSSTQQNPSKTYSTAGNYSARLTVTDNRGGSATSNVISITPGSNPNLNVDVGDLKLVANSAKSGGTGTATIVVRDGLGSAVAGVTIVVQWSGVVSGTSTARTDSQGTVTLTSPKTKKVGSLTVTVTGVTPPAGRAYDSMLFAPRGSAATTSVTLN